jgi:hypothetical protein
MTKEMKKFRRKKTYRTFYFFVNLIERHFKGKLYDGALENSISI